MSQEEFMRRAIALSIEAADAGGGPFGAVIVKNDSIIAEGFNQVTTGKDPTAHAEINAIRGACRALDTFNLSGCEIFASCEPCPMCLGAIYWARLDRMWFANARHDAAAIDFDDALLYRELLLPIEARRLPTRRILADEAIAAFDAWRAKPDKIPY